MSRVGVFPISMSVFEMAQCHMSMSRNSLCYVTFVCCYILRIGRITCSCRIEGSGVPLTAHGSRKGWKKGAIVNPLASLYYFCLRSNGTGNHYGVVEVVVVI